LVLLELKGFGFELFSAPSEISAVKDLKTGLTQSRKDAKRSKPGMLFYKGFLGALEPPWCLGVKRFFFDSAFLASLRLKRAQRTGVRGFYD